MIVSLGSILNVSLRLPSLMPFTVRTSIAMSIDQSVGNSAGLVSPFERNAFLFLVMSHNLLQLNVVNFWKHRTANDQPLYN